MRLIIKIKNDPITSIYPVSSLGSKVGFSLLIKIKLTAWANIDRKINISPSEIDDKPLVPTIEVIIIPIKPSINPNTLNLVIISFKRIIDKTIVINGAEPKIIPAFTPVVIVKQIGRAHV